MTREEAYNRIDAIIAKYEIDDEYVTITNFKDYDALRIAREILEQESITIYEIPKDYKYDTETEDFLVYRHKYTGDEIHIKHPIPLYRLDQEPCEDCISREEVLNVIFEDDFMKKHMNGDVWERLEELIGELPSVQPQQRWIPVSERLPNYRKKVLVCYETEEGLEVDTSMFDKYGCRRGNAVAWMPLPKAYKAESEVQDADSN